MHPNQARKPHATRERAVRCRGLAAADSPQIRTICSPQHPRPLRVSSALNRRHASEVPGCGMVMCPRSVTMAFPAPVVPDMTDPMLTQPSPPGKVLRSWLCFRWMTPRIHKQ